MSILDQRKIYPSACPDSKCKGDVEYWYFSEDCRGNPSSSGYQCLKCGNTRINVKNLKNGQS